MKTKTQKNSKKLLEGFAYARPLAIKLGNVLCKVFHGTGYMAFAHTVVTIDVVSALAVI